MVHKSKNKTKGVNSGVETVTFGVPQGSILGPVLFLIYINDIGEFVPVNNIFQFADDTTIFTKGRICEDVEVESFSKVNAMAQYFSNNNLKLNTSKTNYMYIQTLQRKNSTNNTLPNLYIGEDQIALQTTADFLGVKLDDTLHWDEQVDKVVGNMAKGLFVLRSVSKLKNNQLSKMIYHSLIESHLAYSIVLWGAWKGHMQRAFVWQKKAIRAMNGLSKFDQCREVFRRCGILTVPSLFIYESIMYIKTVTGPKIQLKHNYNTRNKSSYARQHKLAITEKKPEYIGNKLYQKLPHHIKIEQKLPKFKFLLKNFLIEHSFYSLQEFSDC